MLFGTVFYCFVTLLPFLAAEIAEDQLPPWLINHPKFEQTGKLVPTKDIKAFQDLTPVRPGSNPPYRGWDNEAYDGIHRFFWGQEQGIVLEMGALDGKEFSVSNDFLPYHWHRILIEATPKWHEVAKRTSPDATYIGAAICNSESKIHYLTRPSTDNAINGIAEFMNEHFMSYMHPKVYQAAMKSGTYNLSTVDWNEFHVSKAKTHADSVVHIIHCVRMHRVLELINAKKVNFFVLDIEGGELEVLKSIDFSIVSFDVLCIEVEEVNRPPHYRDDITKLLAKFDYEFVFEMGRNAWYKAKSFQPING